jgi:hypothetical protein
LNIERPESKVSVSVEFLHPDPLDGFVAWLGLGYVYLDGLAVLVFFSPTVTPHTN